MNNVYLLCGLALIAANLPFFFERIIFCIPAKKAKGFHWRLLEMVLLYLALGVLARVLEGRLSSVHEQNWPFFASTFAMFIVFAWPGFVWRYFWRKPGV